MWCPRQDSNLRSRLRRAVLYPLSYGGRGIPTWDQDRLAISISRSHDLAR